MKTEHYSDPFFAHTTIYPFIEEGDSTVWQPDIRVTYKALNRETGLIETLVQPIISLNFTTRDANIVTIMQVQEALSAAVRFALTGQPAIPAPAESEDAR